MNILQVQERARARKPRLSGVFMSGAFAQQPLPIRMAAPTRLFFRSRCKLGSAAVAEEENLALKQAFRELKDSYSRNN